jgi:hypothetical protein
MTIVGFREKRARSRPEESYGASALGSIPMAIGIPGPLSFVYFSLGKQRKVK